MAAIAISVALGALYEARHPELSGIDEFQHVDYAQRASHGDIIRRGDLVREPAMRAEACRGLAVPDFTPPPCGAPVLVPTDFQNEGQNTAFLDPPLYYFVTGSAARLLTAITPRGDFVTWARLVGSAWVALAFVGLWAAGGLLGIPVSRRFAVLLILAATPIVLFTQATVTSDAVLMATGAGVLWAVLRWEKANGPAWVALTIVGLGTLGKLNAAVAALICAGYLIVRSFDQQRARPRKEYLLFATLLVGMAGFVSLIWMLIVEQRALIPAEEIVINDLFKVDHLTLSNILGAASATLSPIQNPPLGRALEPGATFALISLQHVLLVFPGLACVFLPPPNRRLQALATTTLALSVTLGPLVVIWAFYSQGVHYPIPPRYALTLLPGMGLLLASRIVSRAGLTIVVSVGGLSYLYFLSRLV